MKRFLPVNCLTRVLINLSNAHGLWISLTGIWLKTRFEGRGVGFPGSVTLTYFGVYHKLGTIGCAARGC